MGKSLKPRQIEMLKYLMASTAPLDVSFFTEKFHKSERTIRYDINEIKEVCTDYEVEIRYQTKRGFFIPASHKMACSEILVGNKSQEDNGFLIDSDEERYKKLFLYLFTRREKVSTEQIAEYFFISRSTLMRLLSKMEEQKDEHLQFIDRSATGYELAGDELALRLRATAIMAESFKGSYTPEDWSLLVPRPLKEYINLQAIIAVTNGIKKINGRYNVWISNTAFLNLLSYCLIRNIRYYQINLTRGTDVDPERYSSYVTDLLHEISIPGEKLQEQEAQYLQRVLIRNGIVFRRHGEEIRRLEKILRGMLEELGDELDESLGKMDREALLKDLYGHLRNSICLDGTEIIHQEENDIVIQEVRENEHSFYLAAKECAGFLEERLHIQFTETEICYIAVYLHKNCEEKEDSRKNVMVVCATGKGLSHLLSIRLEKVFPMLHVVGQMSPYQLSLNEYSGDVDFIISTIPIPSSRVPVVKISRILSEDDIKRIREFLDYGKLIDEIPLKQKNEASFGAKTDPFALTDESLEGCDRKELVYAASFFSKLILTLLEYTSKFPERYQMGQDALLGMIIHMSMAVPRWFEKREGGSNEEYKAEYENIRRNHSEIYAIMEKFFELVESTLRVKIPVEEKTAFFLYIIKED